MLFSHPHRSMLTATIATVVLIAPMAVAALPAPTLTKAGSTTLTVSWPVGTGVNTISWSTAATGPFESTSTGTGTSTTSQSALISGLKGSTDYYVRLSNTKGEYGPVTKFTTAPAVPAPTLTKAGSNALTVSWPAGTGVNSIGWSTAGTGPFESTSTSGTSASIAGLSPGKYFYVRLGSSTGEYGPVTKFLTAASATTAPPPTVAKSTVVAVSFTWTTPTTAEFAGADKYELEWHEPGKLPMGTLVGTATGVTLSGLKAATAYEVRLNIYKVGSWMYSSPFVTVTTPTAPAAATDPLTIKPPTLTVNSAVIGWTGPVANAFSYTVTASLDPTFKTGPLTTAKSVSAVAPVTFSGLAYKQTYYFRVTTVGGVPKVGPTLTVTLPSDESTTVSAPTLYVPGVHTQALQLAAGQAGTSWTSANVAKVDYYRIAKMIKLANGYDAVQGYATATSTVHQEAPIAAGTQVYWRIQNCWTATGCGSSADYRYTVK